MKNDDLLQTILESYDDSNYPEAFVSEYDIMECLSDQNGICTFLVQKKDGENCIAKCYDKLRWGISDNTGVLTNGREPAFGQCQMGSLTGADASERVTEASKGSLRMVGNHSQSAKAEGSLTARPTGRAGTKVGLTCSCSPFSFL